MKQFKTIYILCYMLLAGWVHGQQVYLSGPSSVEICDLHSVKLVAQIEMPTEDLTNDNLRPGEDQPLWRYEFQWLNEDDQQIYSDDNYYAVYYPPLKTHVLSLANYNLYSQAFSESCQQPCQPGTSGRSGGKRRSLQSRWTYCTAA